jgi:hypothetical protein
MFLLMCVLGSNSSLKEGNVDRKVFFTLIVEEVSPHLEIGVIINVSESNL